MEIKVQITVRSEAGEPEVVEVARLERGPLRPDTLGLSLAEAQSILAGLEQTFTEQQTAELGAQEHRCPRCGRQRACKGHPAIRSTCWPLKRSRARARFDHPDRLPPGLDRCKRVCTRIATTPHG